MRPENSGSGVGSLGINFALWGASLGWLEDQGTWGCFTHHFCRLVGGVSTPLCVVDCKGNPPENARKKIRFKRWWKIGQNFCFTHRIWELMLRSLVICVSILTIGLKGNVFWMTLHGKKMKNVLDWSSKCYMFIVIILLMEEIRLYNQLKKVVWPTIKQV